MAWGPYPTIEKAVSILRDGNPDTMFRTISEALGREHKVRNFYNNIIAPNSADGHVTIDTHAVAAALVKALSGSATEVLHNFDGSKKGLPGAGANAASGASGVYGIYADAYRDAAAQLGLLPRELQSITWEAVRSIFTADFKTHQSGKVEAIYDRYMGGEIGREQARQEAAELVGGLKEMPWENTPVGRMTEEGGTSFDGDVSDNPAKRDARVLEPGDVKDKILVTLSAATASIPGIAELHTQANRGDAHAAKLLQDAAHDALKHLLAGTSARIKRENATGLFWGEVEPSLGVSLTFNDEDRPQVLAALAKFADNFNQYQVHVRQDTKDAMGTQYADGSYATPVYRWELNQALDRKAVQRIIDKSGLPGLTFGDDFIEAYFVGDASNAAAIDEFHRGADASTKALGGKNAGLRRQVARLWLYGHGDGAIGYEHIQGDVSAPALGALPTARRVAEYLNAVGGKPGRVKTFEQAAEISPEQDALQRDIARAYESLPDNDLKNPRVRKAYQRLSAEVLRQFKALPVKVEVMTGQGEPYANSNAMRRDLADNNHLFIFGTTAETFGPPGEDFSKHPLLKDSGLKDQNGHPLLFNDLIRAVHDYYAHALSPAQFGPKGEEAAWKNHMAMTADPWARWALTMETRGQNSWVNFRGDLDAATPIKDRPFARQKAALIPVEYALTGDRVVDAPMRRFIEELPEGHRQGSKPEKEVRFSQRGVLAEVAPHPDQEVAQEWREMSRAERVNATEAVARKTINRVFELMGLKGWSHSISTGSFEGEVNPNVLLKAPEGTPTELIQEVAQVFGYVWDQKAMIEFDESNTSSDSQSGFVKVVVPQGMPDETIDRLRAHIAQRVPQADGDALRDGSLVYGNFSEFSDKVETLTDDQYADAIADAVGGFQWEGKIEVLDPERFHSGYIQPETRDDYLKDTRYGRSNQAQAEARGDDLRWRRGLRELEYISEEAIALRDRWIAARKAGRGRPAVSGPGGYVVGPPEAVVGARSVSDRGDGAAGQSEIDGEARRGAVVRVGVHFSKERRRQLNSGHYGTGLRGREATRLNSPENADIRRRLYFYVPRQGGDKIVPETGVGAYAHTVELQDLYPLSSDPLGFVRKSRPGLTPDEKASAWERDVLNAGYSGYLNDEYGGTNDFAVLLGEHNIQIGGARHSQRQADYLKAAEDAGYDTGTVYYHGTAAKTNFARFKPGKGGYDELGPGIYVTSDPWYADAFNGRGDREGGRTMPVFLRKGELADLSQRPGWRELAERVIAREADSEWKPGELSLHIMATSRDRANFNRWLARAGYVGAIDPRSQIPGQVVVFDPTSLKSAIGNRGTFDPTDPDIRRSQRSGDNEGQGERDERRHTPSGIPAGLPGKRTGDSERLERAVAQDLRRHGEPAAGLFRLETIAQDQLPDALRGALEQLRAVTGVRAHIFRNLTPQIADFNGVNLRDGVVHINENSEHPATLTATHEWLHNLRRTQPELYGQLADEVARQGRLPEYQQHLRRTGETRWQDTDVVEEELTAAAVSDAMTDPVFLQRLAERDPGLFRRVAQAFLDFLSTLTAGWRDQGSNAYLRDVEAFRDQLAQVLAAHEQGDAAGGPARHSRRADVSPLGLYSELTRKVDESSMRQAPAGAWKAYIKALTAKGVKPDEILWSGVEDWLELQPGKVPKEAVVEFLRGNGVQVNEAVLAKRWGFTDTSGDRQSFATKEEAQEALDQTMDWIDNESAAIDDQSESSDPRVSVVGSENDTLFEAAVNEDGVWENLMPNRWGDYETYDSAAQVLIAARDALNESRAYWRDRVSSEIDASGGDAKYGDYVLPGGENYREVLLTLPHKTRLATLAEVNEARARHTLAAPLTQAEYERMVAEGSIARLDAEPQGRDYKSSHFDEPNILAHLRVDDRAGTIELPMSDDDRAQQAQRESVAQKLMALRQRMDALGNEVERRHSEAWAEKRKEYAPLVERGEMDSSEMVSRIMRELPTQYPESAEKARLQEEFKALASTAPAAKKPPQRIPRVLFVEEVQSDWGQDAKKKGVKTPRQARVPNISAKTLTGREFVAERSMPAAAAQAWLDGRNAMRSDMDQAPITMDDMFTVIYEDGTPKIVRDGALDAEAEAGKYRRRYEAMVREASARHDAEQASKVPAAPFIGKTDGWLNLALKRALSMAVEGDYDAVAFVTGEQSAERYDLSKQVSEVTYNAPEGWRAKKFGAVLKAFDQNGAEVISKKVDPSELEDYIGKEAAKKLIETTPVDGLHTLSGQDLKVGGEGMKTFYDQIVPNAAKALLKKTGGSMSTIRLDGVGTEQPGFVITDKMRESVQAGQPMFSRRQDEANNVLKALSQVDGLFRVAKSGATTVDGIAADISKDLKARRMPGRAGRQEYELTMPSGRKATLTVRSPDPNGETVYGFDDPGAEGMASLVTERPGENSQDVPPDTEDVWLDVSNLKGEGEGVLAYALAANFAHNTGRIFIGDPAGLSDAAMRRRPEQMLSSALKFGTTAHLAPHPRQIAGDRRLGVPPLKWVYGDDLGNVSRLVDMNLKAMENAGETSITFDPKNGTYLDSEGAPLDLDGLSLVAKSGHGRDAGAGRATLARRAVLDSLVRGAGETGRGENGRPDALLADLLGLAHRHPGATREIFYSRRATVGDHGRAYTPEQRTMFERTGRTVETPTIIERAKAWRQDIGKKLAQGIVDQFRPIRDLDAHAYSLARLSKGASGAFEALLHHGKLKIADGVYDADTSGGFMERVAKPLGAELDDFVWWVATHRAERLAGEDRERLFTPADIAAGKSLGSGQMAQEYVLANGQTTRDRALAYADALKKLDAFNKNVLDMAEQSGLIDGSTRPHWDNEFYVPFYRVSEEDAGFIGEKIKGGLARQRAFKALKGGEQKLNSDLVQNMLQNWAHLIDASAKNRAAKETMEAALGAGIAIEASQDLVRQLGKQAGAGTAWFMDEGKERHFLIEDPYVLEAINSLSYAGLKGPMMTALSQAKHWLTLGVTASPGFKVRNLIRDSLQAIATADLGYNPLTNLEQGRRLTAKDKAGKRDPLYVSALASGGLIRFGTSEGSQADRMRRLAKAGVPSSTVLSTPQRLKAFYDQHIRPGVEAYNEIGSRGEEINRAALYAQLVKKGVSPAEAALQARDLMDFSMQGTWGTIRFLTQVVPFFNARLQGLYKLGRAAQEDPRRFSIVLGATALASVALLAAYADDDDWKKREDWDRDGFWWFKFGGVAFRIPKPFEIGALASVAERGVELFTNNEFTMQRFLGRMKAIAGDNLSMNPVPQALKPIIDLYANVDSFSGRPIESMGMERLQADYRFNSHTSVLARGASTALNAVSRNTLGAETLSPVQIDHLIRAYFGWLGTFSVAAADLAIRPTMSEPNRPSIDYLKVVTQGIAATVPADQSRYVSAIYEQAKELDRVYATHRQLVRDGKVAEASGFAADNADMLRRQRLVATAKKIIAESNQRVRAIERNPAMESDEKRERISREKAIQSDAARRVY